MQRTEIDFFVSEVNEYAGNKIQKIVNHCKIIFKKLHTKVQLLPGFNVLSK